jgi:hypothetical protein
MCLQVFWNMLSSYCMFQCWQFCKLVRYLNVLCLSVFKKILTLDTINCRIHVIYVLKCPYDWLNHTVTEAFFILSSYQICQSYMYDRSAFMCCHAETHIHQKKRNLQEVRDWWILTVSFFVWQSDLIPIHGLALWGFMITFIGHTTFCRTPLDEWSAQHRNLNLITHNTHKTHTSMTLAGFELTIPACRRPQTHALDCADTGIGLAVSSVHKNRFFQMTAQNVRACSDLTALT